MLGCLGRSWLPCLSSPFSRSLSSKPISLGETDREDAGECDVIGEGGGDGEVRLLAASLAEVERAFITSAAVGSVDFPVRMSTGLRFEISIVYFN